MITRERKVTGHQVKAVGKRTSAVERQLDLQVGMMKTFQSTVDRMERTMQRMEGSMEAVAECQERMERFLQQ